MDDFLGECYVIKLFFNFVYGYCFVISFIDIFIVSCLLMWCNFCLFIKRIKEIKFWFDIIFYINKVKNI